MSPLGVVGFGTERVLALRFYGLYIPSSRWMVADLDLELFPNWEQAGWMLLNRTREGESKTFYVRDEQLNLTFRDRPVSRWERADGSGYMRVWKRRAADPVPDMFSPPDEEWFMSDTLQLVRLDWEPGGERLRPSVVKGRARHDPSPRGVERTEYGRNRRIVSLPKPPGR